MIVQKEFLSKLKEFGLNSYESKLWAALLSRGVSTAGELSDIANVPRSRSYDVLESLEKKGFIIMKLGKPIKYVAVPPSEVLERVKKKVRNDADRHEATIDKLKTSDVLEELKLLHKQGIEMVDPSEISGSIKGRENIYDHLETLTKGAEKSITIMTTGKELKGKVEYLRKQLLKAKERGIKVRIAVSNTKGIESDIDAVKAFAEIKETDSVKSRFFIVDGKEIVFMLLDDKEVHPAYDVGVWVNTQFFAHALEKMFDLNWQSMKKR